MTELEKGPQGRRRGRGARDYKKAFPTAAIAAVLIDNAIPTAAQR
jgi:hypothetical protein